MIKKTYLIKSYLRSGESLHFARKYLPKDPPRIIHDHDHYECFWLDQGNAIHQINHQACKLSPWQILFIRPPDLHAFQAIGESACRLINITIPVHVIEHLGERYTENLQNRFFWQEGNLPAEYRLSEQQTALLSRLAKELELSEKKLIDIEGFLLAIATRILNDPFMGKGEQPDWLREVCRIARNPDIFRKGAAGLVKTSGYTHEYVCRVMKKYLNTSPSDYVNRIRMEYASRLLANSNENLLNIAFECGIENMGHFYGLFRKQFGMTPNAYRKRYGSDPI